jgi:hypothetical protein
MRRTLVTAVGLAGLAATAVPVLAAPTPVDEGRTAGMQVTTRLPGGDTLRLDISAAELSAGPRLVIQAVRCDDSNACDTQPYAGTLRAGELDIAASDPRATLRTTLDGRPLVITWKPAPDGGYTVGGGTLDGDGQDMFGTEYAGSSTDTTVSFDGIGCQGTGGVGDGAVVDTAPVSGGEAARPLSALHLPEGAALRC